MRYRVLLGSSIAVLLVAAVAAFLLRGDGTPRNEPAPLQAAAVSQGGPMPAMTGPPEVERATPPPAPVPPSFDVVKVGPTGTAVIAGRAEPGARVIVRDGDKAIGEVTADQRGEWVLVPEQPIAPGNRVLSAEAANPAGGPTVKSAETVALAINPSSSAEGASETALAVVLPRDVGRAARVLQLPDGASAGKPNSLSMDTAEYNSAGRVVLSGRAAPGTTVQIYAGGEPLATVTADAAGKWTATSPKAVPAGDLELRLDHWRRMGASPSASRCPSRGRRRSRRRARITSCSRATVSGGSRATRTAPAPATSSSTRPTPIRSATPPGSTPVRSSSFRNPDPVARYA